MRARSLAPPEERLRSDDAVGWGPAKAADRRCLELANGVFVSTRTSFLPSLTGLGSSLSVLTPDLRPGLSSAAPTGPGVGSGSIRRLDTERGDAREIPRSA
jgi:hypothetical protein